MMMELRDLKDKYSNLSINDFYEKFYIIQKPILYFSTRGYYKQEFGVRTNIHSTGILTTGAEGIPEKVILDL